MKGYRLWTVVFVLLVLTTTSTMAILNFAPSWSQYALTALSSLLLATLYSISVLYRDRSWLHPKKNELLFKIGKLEFNQGQWNRVISILFALIMFTPVTLLEFYPEAKALWSGLLVTMHYIFTGAGLLAAYIAIFFYYTKSSTRLTYLAFMILSVLGFGAAFIYDWYTIGVGEIIASLPPIFFILSTNKESNDKSD
jgi:hypothetical protein